MSISSLLIFIIVFIIGFIFGLTIKSVYESHYITGGIIEVDHNTELCKVKVSSEKIQDRKIKKVVFDVNHDAIIENDNNR